VIWDGEWSTACSALLQTGIGNEARGLSKGKIYLDLETGLVEDSTLKLVIRKCIGRK